MSGGENKYISNNPNILNGTDFVKTVQIGVVVSVDDPESMGRIKVKIPGPAIRGGDDGTATQDLPWSYPMMPKFYSVTPKVGEGVFIITFIDQTSHGDRLFFGPIISQLNNLNFESVNTTALNPFTFGTTLPRTDFNRIPALNGVFPKPDDVAFQGRFNTDIIQRKNEILIRAGKFVLSEPNENNPFSFQFNSETPGYIQIKNDIPIEPQVENQIQQRGSVTNIVGSKINLLTHKDGFPRFNLANQETQLSDDEILNILENAHPLPFGDLLIQYLKLLKNAFINHVHNNNGRPPTDLVTSGNQQAVLEFKKNAEDLENRMLSKNIRIN
jgi:hypothetical protein